MNEPTMLSRPRWCPQCNSRMQISGNPYFGVGLAVHRYLSACRRCGFIEFVPSTPHAGADQDLIGSTRERRRWWRLRELIARLFAPRR
jgi:hypothetical protein